MNTLQSNNGKSINANLTEQTAQNATQTAKNQAEPFYNLLHPDQGIISTVRTFFNDRDIPEMIGIINDITADWLTQFDEREEQQASEILLCRPHVRNSLFVINRVIEFILTLQEHTDRLFGKEAKQAHDNLIKSYEGQISLLNQLAEGREQAIEQLKKRVSLLSTKEQSELQD